MIRQILALGFITIATSSVAQTTDPFEEFKRQREQEMKSFENDYKRGLDSLRESQNRDFALLLAGKWSEREVATAPPIHELPKPEIPPSVEEEKPASLPTMPVVLPEIPAQPSEPAETEPSSGEPETEELPSHEVPSDSDYMEEDTYRAKIEGATMGLNLTSSSFLGNATWLPQLSAWPVCSKPLNSKSIADYWKECSEKSIEAYISYLKTQRELLHLSDWALIELVKQWSTSLLNDRNDASLFTWFILVQSGYDVRLMYTDRGAYLAYPFENMFYGHSFIEMNGIKYFLLDDSNERSLFTYDGSHAGAKSVFSIEQNGRTLFPDAPESRTFSFVFDGLNYNVDMVYNRYRSAYYSSIPQAELDFYFSDAGADQFELTCNSNLRSQIDAIPSQRDKVRFLYALVCAGIPYATDQEQFGFEKFCIAEESLQYSHADCEDRTFLLNYLIRTLVGVPTIGLNYPGHVAMAVMLDDVRPTDARFNYKNQTWVFCDPTYIGADVGMMPGVYESETPEVFE